MASLLRLKFDAGPVSLTFLDSSSATVPSLIAYSDSNVDVGLLEAIVSVSSAVGLQSTTVCPSVVKSFTLVVHSTCLNLPSSKLASSSLKRLVRPL